MSTEQTHPLLNDIVAYAEYSLRGITCWEEIPGLGTRNIVKILAKARTYEGGQTARIHSLVKQRQQVENLTSEKVLRASKNFENPTDMKIGILTDGFGDLEPVDVASRNRAGESTTFNICGWCQHNSGGSGRHSYHISGSCRLMHQVSQTVYFDTPCLLHAITPEKVAEVVASINQKIEEIKANREKTRTGIRILLEMRDASTVYKPLLLSLQPADYHNVGDCAVVYLGHYEGKIVEGSWVNATITKGYRHHDGYVSYLTEFPVTTSGDREGGAGSSRPEVLKKADFDFLCKAVHEDPEFLRLWLDNVEASNLDKELFTRHLLGVVFAQPPEKLPGAEPVVSEPMTVSKAVKVLHTNCKPSTKDRLDILVEHCMAKVTPDKMKDRSTAAKTFAKGRVLEIQAAREFLLTRV
jgi:hypothetical protein